MWKFGCRRLILDKDELLMFYFALDAYVRELKEDVRRGYSSSAHRLPKVQAFVDRLFPNDDLYGGEEPEDIFSK